MSNQLNTILLLNNLLNFLEKENKELLIKFANGLDDRLKRELIIFGEVVDTFIKIKERRNEQSS